MIQNTVEIITTFIECFIACQFLSDIFRSELSIGQKTRITIINTIIVTAINQINIFSYLALILAIVGLTIQIKLCTKQQILTVLSFGTIYYTLVHLLDFLYLSIWCVIMGNIDNAVNAVITPGSARIFFIVSIKIITIILYFCLRKNVIQNIKVEDKYSIYILLFSLGLYLFDSIAVNGFFSNSYAMLRINCLVEWLIAVVLLIAVIYIFTTMTKIEQKNNELALHRINNDMLSDNINIIKNEYYRNAKINHDHKHHLDLLYGYIDKDEKDKALDYIKGLGSKYVSFKNIKYTGIEEIDIILNYKIGIAENNGINVDHHIEFKDISKIPVQDMCIILSNAFDNAINANAKNTEKDIFFSIIQRNDILFIEIDNPISNETGITVPENTKDKNHGWGLKSIGSAVKKNGGIMNYSVKDNRFILSITLF